MSCHSLLAWRVSIDRSAVILMGIPLCVICCFSLAAFNICSLCLIFLNLINMCLGVFHLGFILFGTLWVSWTWVPISFPILGKFSTIISWSIFSWPFFLSSSSVLFFPRGYVALWDSKTPHKPGGERVSWCLETSPSRLCPQDGSPSMTFLSLFLSFIFCPTPFWREWVAFLGAWCSPLVFRSCFVEVVQYSMIFWWICGGESGLPVLFLCHLRTAS